MAVSSANSIQNQKESVDHTNRRIIALITWFTILFVPVYSETKTADPTGHHSNLLWNIIEESFIWPWMIITRYTAMEGYAADQFVVIAVPWSLILFIPFLYAINSTWQIYKSEENKAVHSAQIVLASIAQLFILFMTYKSQIDNPNEVTESITVFYIPQIILIILHGVLSISWFYESVEKSNK